MQQSGYIVSILVLLSTLLLALLSLFVMIIIQKHKKRVVSQRTQINRLVHNQEKKILDAQIKIQEQTFKSISSEIHDNIGQRLTLAKLQLNIALGNPKILDSVKIGIHDAVNSLTECIAELRDLSRSLSYDRIGIFGFQELIENDLKQLISVYPITYKCQRHGELHLIGIEKEMIIYRIFQEIIQNTIKHASANEFSVHLHYKQEQLEVIFKDDGVGFDVKKIKIPNGLNNIRDRASSINSTIEIHSNCGQGTRITLKIPYNEHAQNKSNSG
jgi:two-component system NarL family sensor kinase